MIKHIVAASATVLLMALLSYLAFPSTTEHFFHAFPSFQNSDLGIWAVYLNFFILIISTFVQGSNERQTLPLLLIPSLLIASIGCLCISFIYLAFNLFLLIPYRLFILSQLLPYGLAFSWAVTTSQLAKYNQAESTERLLIRQLTNALKQDLLELHTALARVNVNDDELGRVIAALAEPNLTLLETRRIANRAIGIYRRYPHCAATELPRFKQIETSDGARWNA